MSAPARDLHGGPAGRDLRTYAFKGTAGRTGLELRYDALLQGKTGGAIYRVDPAGFFASPSPKERQIPVQGNNLHTSLDIDLQLAADQAIGRTEDVKGAVVALDVAHWRGARAPQ